MAYPPLAKTALQGLPIAWTFRAANTLRALVIANPAVAFGVGLGGHWFNVASGKAMLWTFPFLSAMHVAVGVCAWKMSKLWGRSTVKDLTILALYGLIMGILVSMNLTAYAAVLNLAGADHLGKLFSITAALKISTNVVETMLGYPLLKVYDSFKK